MQRFTLLTIGALLLLPISLFSQNIKVHPYLQDASPHSIIVMWETDSGEESTVDWGLTDELGQTTSGTADPSENGAYIHTVRLDGLTDYTPYYYRVRTGTAISHIHRFRTPPHAHEHEPFRIIAMSDMQRDGSEPDKFHEIIHDGVLDYLADEIGGEVSDNLALVMIPGDLVVTGTTYSQWENHFFTPSQDLFSDVPVYPVLGNHENNTTYYFQYFHLPDNGTPGFEEHWWYKDYGNVRIIGLNSNAPFTSQDQLDWLSGLLDTTCSVDSVDFVFAQLHHPHKSELWTPGESDFTGEVIELLESFTTDCGKPSIHFFGHTHGYSRGQSRDHRHLWINVATAGGAIDNWGEFPNFDYDEFSVSQDEYGFVSVEVTGGEDPHFVVKRISRGNEFQFRDNEVRDSFVISRTEQAVNTPQPLFPIEEEVIPECVVLQASAFSSPDENRLHGQSHWQVATLEGGFNDPLVERWKNYENWYDNANTQAGDDLSDERITTLDANTQYWWRVRYRDRSLNWSAWTTPVSFSTGASSASDNLLQNPGAEDNLIAWSITQGVVESLPALECNGVQPHSGERYFIVGGLCEHSAVARCQQDVDVSAYADSIDTGGYAVNFGGYLANFGGSDRPEMRLYFLDDAGLELGTSTTLTTLNSNWTLLNTWELIPADTRSIRVELQGTRNAGTDNDSYFDDLFLRLGSEVADCAMLVSSTGSAVPFIPELEIYPNPFRDTAEIILPAAGNHWQLQLMNALGEKVSCPTTITGNRIQIDGSHLAEGTYLFLLRQGQVVVGKGKLVRVK